MLSRASGHMQEVGASAHLNCVKSRIREAAAQAHPESRKHIHGPLRSCSVRPST